MIDAKDIKKLGELSRIALTEDEIKAFVGEIDAILSYVGQIQNVSSQMGGENLNVSNVFRKDNNPHESGIYTNKILDEAPDREGQYFKVKKILNL